MQFNSFLKKFGGPAPETGINLESLELSHSQGLKKLVDEMGGGVFAEGLISLISVRELIDDLGGWQYWLPTGSKLFGSSVFGLLMITQGDNVWIVDTQYGQVVESDYSIEDFIISLTTSETIEEVIRAPLFYQWNQMLGNLPPTHVLCPAPALPLGGRWTVDTLSAVSLPVYLSFTGQLFHPDGGMPAEVLRL